jgi:hypothetical protein
MATWEELGNYLSQLGGRQPADTIWILKLPGSEESRTQTIGVSLEQISPDFEFIKITSAVAMITDVDMNEILRRYGQLLVGCIAYTPAATKDRPDDGIVNLASTSPLAALDLRDPSPFLLYLHVLARAADTVERELAKPGVPDLF